jgi:hypothetical protein
MGVSNQLEWWIVGIAILLLLLFIYLDVKSRPKKLRWARFIALIVVIGSLLGLYAKLYREIEPPNVQVAFITENADQSTIDSLRKAGFLLVNSLEEHEKTEASSTISELVLVGDGLEEWELGKVGKVDAFFKSKELEEGIIDFDMSAAVEQSVLDLRFQLHVKEGHDLVVSGSGIETKITKIGADEKSVSMEVIPSISGYVTYQVDGIRMGDTLFSETIPLHVQQKAQPSVLMLASSPSFEFRALKNHLAESGYGIAERLQISTDLYHEAFTNMKERSISKLTNELLNDFQLIVLEGSSYNKLTNAEKQRIKSKLERGELGLLQIGRSKLDLISYKEESAKTFELRGENGKVRLNGSGLEGGNPTEKVQLQNQNIGSVAKFGLGRLAIPSFTDSYALKLQGETALYAEVWQKLLKNVLGSMEKETLFEVADFPRIDEPTTITIRSKESTSEIRVEEMRLAPEEVWFTPNKWTATYWPKKRGWQTVTVNGENQAKFFVYNSADWALQKRLKKQQLTEAYLNQAVFPTESNDRIKEPISKWIFFGLFLAGISFLWIEQRVG